MDLHDKTVLVTGGCGLIGSAIIDQLIDAEPTCRVRIIDNLSRGTLLNIRRVSTGRVELVRKDIRHFSQIRPHFDGVDAVFHQAAIRITRCAQNRGNAWRCSSTARLTCYSRGRGGRSPSSCSFFGVDLRPGRCISYARKPCTVQQPHMVWRRKEL